MPRIDLDILNQKQTPAFYASSLATRPAASFVGRIFIDSDNPSTGLYRDTGTTWIQIADPGAGTTGTLQQVTTNGNTTSLGINVASQSFFGTTATSSGLLVVNSATADSHIVVIGANAPSIRFRNLGLSPTLNIGIGIATATNNFIQGSASGNLCIFNSSTTASPITFGIYDAGIGNTQEAARISAARNILIGTLTDAGYKLDVSGTGRFTGALTGTSATFIGNVASTNFSSTGQISTSNGVDADLLINVSVAAAAIKFASIQSSVSGRSLVLNSTNGGNVLIGTTTDAGYKLDVSGTGRFTSALTGTSATFSSTINLTDNGGGTINNQNGNIFIQTGVGTNWIFRNGASVYAEYMRLNASGNLSVGNTNDIYKLDVSGTGRFTSALTGTSATFSGAVNMGFNNSLIFGISPYRYSIYRSSSGSLITFFDDEYDSPSSTLVFRMRTSGTPITALTIVSTGAATFSSSIAINNTVTASVVNTVTNKVSILIGGVQYYLLASTSSL